MACGGDEKTDSGVDRAGKDWSNRLPRCLVSSEPNGNGKIGISIGGINTK